SAIKNLGDLPTGRAVAYITTAACCHGRGETSPFPDAGSGSFISGPLGVTQGQRENGIFRACREPVLRGMREGFQTNPKSSAVLFGQMQDASLAQKPYQARGCQMLRGPLQANPLLHRFC